MDHSGPATAVQSGDTPGLSAPLLAAGGASEPWKAYSQAATDVPALWAASALRPLLRGFYSARWRVVYPLQRRVCWLGLGEWAWVTIGELLVAAAIVGLLLSSSVDAGNNATKTGSAPQYALALAFSTACHNSVWTFLLGIPFERALLWHKMFAVLAIALGLYHGYVATFSDRAIALQSAPHLHNGDDVPLTSSSMWLSGVVFVGAMVLTALFSLSPIRRHHFEVFYTAHWAGLLTAAVAGLVHGGLMGPGFFLWVADVVVRYAFLASCRHAREATLEILPADVVRVRFPKGAMAYKGGQYVFLCVPELSMWQWHPFSISSAPHESHVTLHCRVLGNWTQRLQDLAATPPPPGLRLTGHADAVAAPGPDAVAARPTRVLLEGPAGSCAVDVDSDRYKVVLCISGGIGITPMQSITNDLLRQHQRGRPLKTIFFVWVVRDRAIVQALDDERHRSQHGLNQPQPQPQQDQSPSPALAPRKQKPRRLPISFQPDLLQGLDLAMGRHSGDAEHGAGAPPPVPNPMLDDTAGSLDAASSPVLHSEFYLTKVRNAEELNSAGISPGAQKCLRFGRPDLPSIFDRVRAEARGTGESRVATLVCGPAGMVDMTRRLSREMSDETVTFDFHSEEFEF